MDRRAPAQTAGELPGSFFRHNIAPEPVQWAERPVSSCFAGRSHWEGVLAQFCGVYVRLTMGEIIQMYICKLSVA